MDNITLGDDATFLACLKRAKLPCHSICFNNDPPKKHLKDFDLRDTLGQLLALQECKNTIGHTTLQSMINAKLSQQRF